MTETPRSSSSYGWWIVAISTLALVISNGLSIGGIPVFYKPIQTDLVASGAVAPESIQSVYGIAPAMTFLLAGFISPVSGFLLQRLRARIMMVLGCFILGGGLLLYSQATSTWAVYAAHALLGTSLGFVGVLVTTVLVSDWFVRRRGLAIGIVLTGTSFGGVLIPQIATPLIAQYGWRTAMIAVSSLVWLILLPAVIFIVKNKPADVGALPDGDARPVDVAETRPTVATGATLAEALRSPIFWLFSFFAALIFYSIFVVSQQLNLYVQSPRIGFSPGQAAGVQSLLFGLSIAGKFIYGALADRFSPTRVMIVSALTMFLSTLTFLDFNSFTVYVFAILFGLNYGGSFVLLQLLVAQYFGLKEFAKILGAVMIIETIGGALGTIITGRIADANGGDYSTAFLGLVATSAVALLISFWLHRAYQRPALWRADKTAA